MNFINKKDDCNLKTESDIHYCLHTVKSPDTCSFCCVSNYYMYYYCH